MTIAKTTASEKLHLPANDGLHLWLIEDNVAKFDEAREQGLPLLSASELFAYQRFVFVEHKHRYLLSRILLRRVLSQYVSERSNSASTVGGIVSPQALNLVRQPSGKPMLAEHYQSNIKFNLSQTNGLTVLAVCQHNELGVDIERLPAQQSNDSPWLDIANAFFRADEIADIKRQSGKARMQRFLQYWTLKESLIKAHGRGLDSSLHKIGFQFIEGTALPHKCVAITPDELASRFIWQYLVRDKFLLALCLPAGCDEVRPTVSVRQLVTLTSSSRCSPELISHS